MIAGADKAAASAPGLFRLAPLPAPSKPRQARRASAAFSAPATVHRRRASLPEIEGRRRRRVSRGERAGQRRRSSIAGTEKAEAGAPRPHGSTQSLASRKTQRDERAGHSRRRSVASVPGTAEYTGKWRKIKPVFMSCRPELFSLYCLRALCKRLEERHQRSEANAGGYIFCRIIDRHKISVLQCADINLVQSANRSINQNNNTIPLVLQE